MVANDTTHEAGVDFPPSTPFSLYTALQCRLVPTLPVVCVPPDEGCTQYSCRILPVPGTAVPVGTCKAGDIHDPSVGIQHSHTGPQILTDRRFPNFFRQYFPILSLLPVPSSPLIYAPRPCKAAMLFIIILIILLGLLARRGGPLVRSGRLGEGLGSRTTNSTMPLGFRTLHS